MQPIKGITQLLTKWSNGDAAALDELIPLVYDELHKLADRYLRREPPGHTLQPTALVHEAYIRLIDQKNSNWQNRAQFFGMAAKLMRNILVDRARLQKASKRGGQQYKLSLSEADRITQKPDVDMVALDDALKELATVKPQHSQVVELRFFGGLTIEETAQVLGTSHATVERQWNFARSWLRRQLSK